MPKAKDKKLKTFTVHECDEHEVRRLSKLVKQYKHIENMLNILLQQTAPKDSGDSYEIFNLLLNSIIMKAVIMGNPGGVKTKETITKVREHFKDNALFNSLVESAK